MIGSSTEPLSGPDNAWRRMGDKTNLMEISGVLMFEDRVEYEDLIAHLEERLIPFDRFKQRIVGRDLGRRPRWEEDTEFDIRAHVHHVALPDPQDLDTFQTFIADIMSRPVDRTKPLWQAYLVEGAGTGNALVIAIHHSIADGFALLYVLMGLADDPSQIEYPVESMPDPPDHSQPSDGTAERASASSSETGPTGETDDTTRDSSILDGVGNVLNMGKTAFDALTMDEEPETSLRADLGVRKQVAWTDAVDLERIRAAGEPYDATINDVLLAVIAGAYRRHLASEGPVDEDLTLRCTVPVNLTPIDDRDEDLGNYFGLGFVELPVGLEGFEERLTHIQETTGELRQGTEAYLMYLLLRIFGRGPPTLQRLVMKLFEDTASSVVTNVPGPTETFTMCGQTVEDMFFWVPQSNGVGLGLSIFSYNGAVRVGVAADENVLEDPFELAELFEAELDAVTPPQTAKHTE